MLLRRCLSKLKGVWREPAPQWVLLRLCCPLSTTGPLARYDAEARVIKSKFPDVTIPNITINQFVWQNYEKWPDATALVCGVTRRSYTYRQGRELARRLAMGFLGEGLRPGQVIACLLPNTPEYPLLILGALEAGFILSTINPLYTVDEIVNQLQDSGSVAIVTLPEKVEVVFKAKKKLAQVNKHQSETLRIFIAPGFDSSNSAIPPGTISIIEMANEHLDTRNLEANMSASISGDDLAVLPYSSGTTGLPKGVCLTHKNVISSLLQLTHSSIKDINSGENQDIIPFILPLYHIYGLVVIGFQGLLQGTKLVTLPKFDEKTFLGVLKEEKATVLYLAPPLILYLGSSQNVTEDHLKTVRLTMSGAAPVGESDIRRCLKKSPKGAIYKQGYGLTECSPAVCCHTKEGGPYDSVGPPVINTKVKVIDVSTGESLPANQNGEICVKGPQVMKGYLNNTAATEESIDKDGWFHTGDIGYYDENTNFYIVDRLKELIKVKGYQVAPSELEEVLRTHPAILDAGVIGTPDKRKGEVPIAYVTLIPNTNPPSKEELTNFLKEKVAPFKLVDNYIFCDSIPKSAAGKILRKELKEMYKIREKSVASQEIFL